ncbi:L,D-transpeptidase family protein [Pedobacter sp. SL55]|uniref:L,D-transpeptidase family protein n=1 Tax=Pedobacter sp. SL55 TaxID=2995161 RepID=UPI00227063A3|nr:L,D-transpeptidase family protein [Pedobacter sp. SL55]WAC39411.1 L,D-transpeptidase family protein [Pedobacter sp. SL55]
MDIGYIKLLFVLLLNLFLPLIGIGQTGKYVGKLPAIKENSKPAQLRFDSLQLQSFLEDHPKLKRYKTELWSFYRKRQFAYVWFDKIGLVEQAGDLTNRLRNLEDDGVFTKLLYAKELDSLVYQGKGKSGLIKPDIKIELLLTGEYFVFAGLAWEGMNPFVSTSNNWMLPRKKISYDLYLDSLLNSPHQGILAKEPVYRQYELLKTYLRKYRLLDDLSDWSVIKANSKVISLKDTAMISQVKKRLFQLEDYDGSLSDTLFDDRLRLALISFQERHGLKLTGLINRETLAALNIPLKTRVKQILVNMERSRWLPVASKGNYLVVNIPEFKLHVYHDENLLWYCEAVVGQAVHPTTLFYGEIDQVVFSPYWNVPESIVATELVQGMRKSANFLADHQMEIIGQRNGLPIVRQRPGAANSLGRVKFMFPNSYSIYLHDTPSKSLFKETDRAFSHGCIRIAEPAKLAAFLLNDDEKWNAETIRSAMYARKERPVLTVNNTPVFIAYFTAFIDRNGKLNFRRDIYGLDERLAAMIISGAGIY